MRDGGFMEGGRYARSSGPPLKTYGEPGDRCCCCGARLSAYHPRQHCARPTCEDTHQSTHTKENLCRTPRKRRTKPPGTWKVKATEDA